MFKQQQQKAKDKEYVQRLLQRNLDKHTTDKSKFCVRYLIEKPNYHSYKSPLRRSGIHFRIQNEWRNQYSEKHKTQLEPELSPDKYSYSRSRSYRG